MTTSFLLAKEWGWSQQANSEILDSAEKGSKQEGGVIICRATN
jgi:hypothetical protein